MESMKMEERRTQLELQHLGDERNGLKAEVMLLRQEAAQHAAESERTRRPGTELTSLPTDKFDLQPTGGRGGRGEQSEGVGEGGGPRRAARASQRVAGTVAAQRREQQSESERERDKRKPLAVITANRPGTLRYSCAHTLTPAPRHPHLRTRKYAGWGKSAPRAKRLESRRTWRVPGSGSFVRGCSQGRAWRMSCSRLSASCMSRRTLSWASTQVSAMCISFIGIRTMCVGFRAQGLGMCRQCVACDAGGGGGGGESLIEQVSATRCRRNAPLTHSKSKP